MPGHLRKRLVPIGVLAAVLVLSPGPAVPDDTRPKAQASGDTVLKEQVRPLLERHCLGCHGPDRAKGDFRVDRLPADLSRTADREQWLSVLRRVESGEMPPEPKPRPAARESQTLTGWITDRAGKAEAAQGRVPLRRLNRTEYQNTIRDLLGVDLDLRELLPLDASADGFDNGADALQTSSFLMERYLEAADSALNVAIANGPQPKLVKKRMLPKDERHIKITGERVFLHRDDDVVFFSSSAWHQVVFSQFYPPDRGRYRFRISASAYQNGDSPVTYRILAGPMLMGTKNHLVGYYDAGADRPTIVEFEDNLEARNTIALLPYGLAPAQAVDRVSAEEYQGPGLAVQWIEVEGPLHDTWPPPSHKRIFGDLPQGPAPVRDRRDRVEVVSKKPMADAERVLRPFARRAFRRPVTDDDLKPYLALVRNRLDERYSFEQAVRVGLKAVLVSPEFLYLREKPGRLDDFALASRLSYFLWSSMPDEELLKLAGQGKLGRPETLKAQVERMLRDRKAGAFTQNFVGQWLGLRDIDFTEPDRRLYPEFDDLLKVSMVEEAQGFFNELLKDDLSLTNFVSSDFAMLNGRLARHYGVGGVEGHAFRKVKLPPDSHRGGVLTMAGVLKVTANGTSTSPVVRGAWVMDRILGKTPPRPPEGVPAVEPDIRGATTIREQLAKHREVGACASCHARIDPPGFALESFDVIGGWRENYRSLGRGQAVVVDGQRMPYLRGPKVDPADKLSDGRAFRDIDGLKQLLLADRDQLARALAHKLLTYATGKAPGVSDRAAVEEIVRKARENGYGLRTLVHAVIESRTFQSK